MNKYEILTPSGFQGFDGVQRYWHQSHLRIIFDDGTLIKCALDHRFIDNQDQVIYAHSLRVGDRIGKVVKEITHVESGDYFYDPVNVQNGNIYLHDNGLVSHNTFLGTSNTLVDTNALLGLKSQEPFFQNNEKNLRIYKQPQKGHEYIMTVDVAKGRGQDFSTFTIFDITKKTEFEQVGVFQCSQISPLLFPSYIWKYATYYNEALVIIENNDVGQVVCNAMHHELEYENLFSESFGSSIGVQMTKKIKRIGCSTIKDLIECNRIKIIDGPTIKEIGTFTAFGNTFRASGSNHDDLMMNLVLFAWFTTTTFFEDILETNIKQLLYQDRIKEIEEDVLPFGFVNSLIESENAAFVDDDGDVWSPVDSTQEKIMRL